MATAINSQEHQLKASQGRVADGSTINLKVERRVSFRKPKWPLNTEPVGSRSLFHGSVSRTRKILSHEMEESW